MKTPKGEPICYLCGILIDAGMVDPTHPLFGTIDHIQPLSLGSRDKQWNRLPAHRICNQTKGNARPSNNLMQACRDLVSADPESKRLRDGMTKANRKRVVRLRLLAANAIFKADGYPL